MVHSVPKKFQADHPGEVQDFRRENLRVLNSLQYIRRDNVHAIAISNHFSSLFASLSNLEDANTPVFNEVSFDGFVSRNFLITLFIHDMRVVICVVM